MKQNQESTRKTRILNGEWIVSSINAVGKTGYPYTRMKLDFYLTPLANINLQWIKDLIVRPETVQFEKAPRPWS